MNFLFDPSLVLYLPLYQLDGASFMSKDASGQVCTVTGALWTPSGRLFDGDDFIVITDTPFDFERTDAFALEIWLKTTSTSAESIFSKQANAGVYEGYSMELKATGQVYLNLVHDAVATKYTVINSTNTVNDGAWHHVIVQNLALSGGDASDIQIFIDGSLETNVESSDTLGANSILNNVNLRIASRDGGGQPFSGTIGEARVYNRALTPLEIQHNYLATKWRYR